MFSIIIPLYNKAHSIKSTIESVLNQNFNKFELLIIDDGSTDSSIEIINNFNDIRIRIVKKVNGGAASARNLGINMSKYNWIAFLDADDIWKKNHLECLAFAINNYHDISILTTATEQIIKKNVKINTFLFEPGFIGFIDDYFIKAKNNTIFNSSSTCLNKLCLEPDDRFDEELKFGEDLSLWFKILKKRKGFLYNIPTVLYDNNAHNRIMNSFCPYKKHLLYKINSFRNNDNNLNEFIDYFILRNSIPYYFSKENSNVICNIFNSFNKSTSFFYRLLYKKELYFIIYLLYKMYKIIKKIT